MLQQLLILTITLQASATGHLRSPPSPTNKETIAWTIAMVSLFVGDGGDLRCPVEPAMVMDA